LLPRTRIGFRYNSAAAHQVHGQDHRAATELGYNLSAVDLLRPDAALDDPGGAAAGRASVGALLRHGGAGGLAALVRGPNSLGALLEAQHGGFHATPSWERPIPVLRHGRLGTGIMPTT
jgi:hypothetical protein